MGSACVSRKDTRSKSHFETHQLESTLFYDQLLSLNHSINCPSLLQSKDIDTIMKIIVYALASLSISTTAVSARLFSATVMLNHQSQKIRGNVISNRPYLILIVLLQSCLVLNAKLRRSQWISMMQYDVA